MTHFYLTLPSNSSMKYYPDNTLTKFTTKLHSAITVQGEWEVGLSEIIFPKNWFNISTEQTIVVGFEASLDRSDYPGMKPISFDTADTYYNEITLDIPKGYYKDVDSLVSMINERLRIAYKDVTCDDAYPYHKNRLLRDGWAELRLNPNTNVVAVSIPSFSSITLTDILLDVLGFSKDDFPLESGAGRYDRSAERVGDVDIGRHTMYIYCDLLENVPIGDTSAPLLRTIDIPSIHGTIIHKHFNQPRYVPLRRSTFESLEIDIRDAFGEPIPFESGSVIVTLHFRRVKSSYFLS